MGERWTHGHARRSLSRRDSCCERGLVGKGCAELSQRAIESCRAAAGEQSLMQERAPAAAVSPRQLAADLAAAFLFSTRLPLPGVSALTGADIARAGWALPVAGAIVGLISALVYWLARAGGLPPLPAAGLTIAASLAAMVRPAAG